VLKPTVRLHCVFSDIIGSRLAIFATPLPTSASQFPEFPQRLAGRVILITGASGGLGSVLAMGCAAQGATVVLHGRVVRKLEALYDRILAAGHPEPTILPLDLAIAKAEDFANVASALQAQHGRVDAIVHTAVLLGSLGPIEHQPFDSWLATLRVDLLAPFGLTRALLPLLRAAPDASVTFTLDTRGQEPKAFWGAYAVRHPRPGAEGVLGSVRCRQGGIVGTARHTGGRMGRRCDAACQRRGTGPDAIAASCADASGR
jgi:NAD(P)-dependent dehydrogenase (short-subunit alcohol dehydrogenase family)